MFVLECVPVCAHVFGSIGGCKCLLTVSYCPGCLRNMDGVSSLGNAGEGSGNTVTAETRKAHLQ